MSRVLVAMAGTWVLAALAGCMPSLESTEPPARIYWLETVRLEQPTGARVRVVVVPGLDSDRIWLLEADQRLNYYAGAFWQDRLRTLLESVLARSLRPAGSPASTMTYRVNVERFFAVETGSGGPPAVELRALIEPERGSTGCRFDERSEPASERLRDVVAAHQRLVDALAREVNRIAGREADGQEAC